MCHIPTQEQIDIAKKKLDEMDFDTVRDLIDELDYRIHIGKRSAGWKFLFQIHPQYYGPDKESIMVFLNKSKTKEWILKNEYNEILDPEEFWQDYVEAFKDGIAQDDAEYVNSRYSNFDTVSDEGFRFTYRDFA